MYSADRQRYYCGYQWGGEGFLLPFIVDYQRADHARDPAAEGKEENDQDRSAPFVDYRQGREEDAKKNPEKTHLNLRFALTKV